MADEAALVENLRNNQQQLINENNALRQALENSKSGKGLIFSKLLDIKKDIGAIGKDQTNTGLMFKFRGIDQFVNSLHPILNKHGVGIITKVLQNSEDYKESKNGRMSKNVRLVMEYTFFAEDGSTVSCQMPSEGVDTSDKATNKALSAALKYCLIQTFCVPTEDMAEADLDNTQIDGNEVISSAKKAAPKKASGNSSFRKPKNRESSVALVDDDEL